MTQVLIPAIPSTVLMLLLSPYPIRNHSIGNWLRGGRPLAVNQARVLINDVSTTGYVDTMKMTGTTFTPVIPGTVATPQVTHAIVTEYLQCRWREYKPATIHGAWCRAASSIHLLLRTS